MFLSLDNKVAPPWAEPLTEFEICNPPKVRPTVWVVPPSVCVVLFTRPPAELVTLPVACVDVFTMPPTEFVTPPRRPPPLLPPDEEDAPPDDRADVEDDPITSEPNRSEESAAACTPVTEMIEAVIGVVTFCPRI